MIIQQAIKHWNGAYLVSEDNSKIQWEDTKGNVCWMSGGNEYLQHSEIFPGSGCEDYTLLYEVHTEEEVLAKKLTKKGFIYVLEKDV